jgi:hypothetical protein
MTDKQFEQFNKNIQDSVSKSIETTVNGKIKRLDEKIDNYIKSDNEWKAGVTPHIETMKQFQGFTLIGTSVLKGILLIGSATGAIYAFIKYLRN